MMAHWLRITLVLVALGLLIKDAPKAQAGLPILQATPAKLPAIWTVDGTEQGGEFGSAVAGAGDINGDGYADIIVGGPKMQHSVYREGIARVYIGGPGGLSSTAGWVVGGGQTGARFGHAVSGAGDVNDDGLDDVLVGANRYNNGQPEEGVAFLFLSSPWGLPLEPSWTYESDQADAQLGSSLAGVGDVNKDGYDDVLVGAPFFTDGDSNEGCVFLFYGDEGGLPATPDWSYCSDQAAAGMGAAVAGAGDLNQDGYGDFAVSAPTYDGPAEDAGAVYVFLGSDQGPVMASGQPILGAIEAGWFGAAVSGGGDINGDGFADLVIGAPFASQSATVEGAVFFYLGNEHGVERPADWVRYGGQDNGHFGASVSSSDDFDGDGLADLLVGASQATDDQSEEGAVYIFRGADTGPEAVASWYASGDKAETDFGSSTSWVGDVDQDGRPEALVGAPEYRIATDLVGRIFLYESQGVVAYPYKIYLPQILLGGF